MPSEQSSLQVTADEEQSQDLNLELRGIIGRAVGFVLGRQATQSFSAITYEELANAQIERIEGEGVAGRPNELARIEALENELLGTIEQIRAIPPEYFLEADPDGDVNTPGDIAE